MPTKIEWADEVWNPIIGCRKVTRGCDNCYAEKWAVRMSKMRKTGLNIYGTVLADNQWNHSSVLRYDELNKPAHWKLPRKIFVCSMSDLFFHPVRMINQVIKVMIDNPQHTYMILTKRPAVALAYSLVEGQSEEYRWPWELIWIGVSAEDQQMYQARFPLIRNIPAMVRFVSLEPLLGMISVDSLPGPRIERRRADGRIVMSHAGDVDWLITGCETGPARRKANESWFKVLASDCSEFGIPFFIKAVEVNGVVEKKLENIPQNLRIREIPKITY